MGWTTHPTHYANESSQWANMCCFIPSKVYQIKRNVTNLRQTPYVRFKSRTLPYVFYCYKEPSIWKRSHQNQKYSYSMSISLRSHRSSRKSLHLSHVSKPLYVMCNSTCTYWVQRRNGQDSQPEIISLLQSNWIIIVCNGPNGTIPCVFITTVSRKSH